MIISTYLLSQFIDLEGRDIEQIAKILNDIGIEVEKLWRLQVSKRVVVGKVVAKSPHPNADKLSVCQVDIGSQTLQIVCGAKNVEQNQFVALALEGAKLPPKDEKSAFFEIKQSNLRGVTSYGMICSSSELGLCKVNDGIMVLDSSVGELELGRELSDYPFFNQYFLEISLTPNRGDCLSVLGVARELASVFDSYVSLPKERENAIALGLGRVLNTTAKCNIDSILLYKVAKIEHIYPSIIEEIALAYNGLLTKNTLENHKHFTTFMTGVLLDIYAIPYDSALPAMLKVQKDEKGFECVYDRDDNKLFVIGVKSYAKTDDFTKIQSQESNKESNKQSNEKSTQNPSDLNQSTQNLPTQSSPNASQDTSQNISKIANQDFASKKYQREEYEMDSSDEGEFFEDDLESSQKEADDSLLVVIQASFLSPHIISQNLFSHKIAQDKATTYRSTRGANPQLFVGMNFFCEILHTRADCLIYSGYQELEMQEAKDRIVISASFEAISQAIGKSVSKEQIAQILKQLDFRLEANGEADIFRIIPPAYRHDIHTQQDITEEFLRVYGIEKIEPKPYTGIQPKAYTPTLHCYLNKRDLAKRALANGFYECIHFLFAQKSVLQEWGYEVLDSTLELSNPITTELDTLRSSLIPSLFESIKRNQNLGYKNMRLFEIGAVYDAKREQKEHFGIVASGLERGESYPHPKGKKWDFYSFCEVLSHILGDFRLEKPSEIPPQAHPHICAEIFIPKQNIDGQDFNTQDSSDIANSQNQAQQKWQKIGIVAKLNPALQARLEIADSFFAEIYEIPYLNPAKALPTSRLHENERDITVLINKDIPFSKIQNTILSAGIEHLSRAYPLDIYEKDGFALTIRLVFTPTDSSLSEDELGKRVQAVLEVLDSSFGAKLKQ